MKVAREWLKDYMGESIPSAEKIEELLTFYAFEVEEIEKVEGDEVIDRMGEHPPNPLGTEQAARHHRLGSPR